LDGDPFDFPTLKGRIAAVYKDGVLVSAPTAPVAELA
jgi:hypothetical protein